MVFYYFYFIVSDLFKKYWLEFLDISTELNFLWIFQTPMAKWDFIILHLEIWDLKIKQNFLLFKILLPLKIDSNAERSVLQLIDWRNGAVLRTHCAFIPFQDNFSFIITNKRKREDLHCKNIEWNGNINFYHRNAIKWNKICNLKWNMFWLIISLQLFSFPHPFWLCLIV